MCSPEVAAIVRETLKKTPGRLDRRRLLANAAAAAMVAGVGTPLLARAQGATPAATPVTGSSVPITAIHDLTHVASTDYPMFPGATPMQIDLLVTIEENGFYKNTLTLDEHTATPVSYTHLRAHETDSYLVCRLLL